jgi:hypothetical protein
MLNGAQIADFTVYYVSGKYLSLPGQVLGDDATFRYSLQPLGHTQ